MKSRLGSKLGFSLIELVVTLGIVAVLTGLGLVKYDQYNRNQKLKQAGVSLKNNLRLAQTKAQSADKPTSGCSTLAGYAVSFTDTAYSLQAQCSEGLVGEIKEVTLPSGIRFSPPPTTIFFKVLSWGVSPASTIYLTNGDKIYALEVSIGGDIGDLGFQ